MRNIMSQHTLSVHNKREVLLKLKAAGLDDNLAQEIIKSRNNEVAIRITEMLRYDIRSRMSQGRALEIMGEDFFGHEHISNVLGNVGDSFPEIQFSEEDLKRAKEFNQQLILQNDLMDVKNPDTGKMEYSVPITIENLKKYFPKAHDNAPIWYPNLYKDECIFTKERPRVGWRLTSKDIIPNSTFKRYLEQADVLVDHMQEQVFKGMKIPKQYEDAIAEFKSKRAEIEPLTKSLNSAEWKRGSQMLVNLNLTKLTRELPVEVMYRLILNDKENEEKLLPSTYTWTAGRDSDGRLVFVGNLDAKGAEVYRRDPDNRFDTVGVSFSRS